MKKILALTAVLLLLVVSMGPSIADTHGQNETPDIVSEVTGETVPPVPPIADVDGPYSCYVHETILLDGSGSYDPDGIIVKYEWDFGDGTTGTGVKPSHTYSSTGTFTVTLTVTDNHDLMDEDTTTVKVSKRPKPPPSPPANKKPKADAGPNQKVWVDRTVQFSGAGSHDKDGKIVSYSWDFGDGNLALGMDVSHIYTEPGHYTVTLTVKDNRGDEGSDTCTVKVYEVPAPLVGEFSELVPAGMKGHIVNASKEANTTITLNTTYRVTVTVLKYERNPYPEDPINATTVPLYADVMVSITEAVEWPIYLEMSYTDEEAEGLDEESLGIYYWINGTWWRCSDTGVDTERNVAWAYMTEEEASGSPILAGGEKAPRPAEFEFSDLVIEPEELEPGFNVIISVLIANVGEETGSHNLTLRMESRLLSMEDEAEVTLDGGESEIISFVYVMDIEGEYDVEVDGLTGKFKVKAPPPPPPKPAEFEVSGLNISTEIEEGANITIFVNVSNVGEVEGTHRVDLILDGEVVYSENVTLPGGTSEEVPLWIEGGLTADTYQVEVEELTGNFTVVELPAPPSLTSPGFLAFIVIVIIFAIIFGYVLLRRRQL